MIAYGTLLRTLLGLDDHTEAINLSGIYNQVLSGLVKMITYPDDWLID
ncbi:hypothetical protein [Hydrococcus rivularis]|nr:hypothetical protein [Hydrococcus rivularis]